MIVPWPGNVNVSTASSRSSFTFRLKITGTNPGGFSFGLSGGVKVVIIHDYFR